MATEGNPFFFGFYEELIAALLALAPSPHGSHQKQFLLRMYGKDQCRQCGAAICR